jgi:hypothetical protein
MGKKVLILAYALLSVLALCSSSHAWPIPDTGQTKCYNDTAEIPCPQPGDPFYGQDGNYHISEPAYDPSLDGLTVTDLNTGLMWQRADDRVSRDWDHAVACCEDLNLGGYSDWRLPSLMDLVSVVDHGRYAPAIDPLFSSQSDMYWSNPIACVDFYYGYNNNLTGDHYFYVRCVRDGEAPRAALVDNGDGTVTDGSTGLGWQQADDSQTYTWQEALSYCENLDFAEQSDWRLPNIRELRSIVVLSSTNPAIDPVFGVNALDNWYWYWSGTTCTYAASDAWSVDFSYGCAKHYGTKSDMIRKNHVRCVRGGQNHVPGNLLILSPERASKSIVGRTMPITWDTAGISGNVKISISRQGGKPGTFETIADSVANNGSYDWTVIGPDSINCALRIEPLSAADNGTSQSLFTIVTLYNVWISAEKQNDLGHCRLALNALYTDGIWPVAATWTSSDSTIATISDNLLSALKNGYVEVSTSHEGRIYTKGLFVYTTADAAEIESNNTKATASTMNESRFYQGKVLAGDTDWFKFTLPTASLLNIGFLSHSASADVKVEIFNAFDALMVSGTSTNGNYLNFPLGLPAGTYYLKLTPAGDIDQDKLYVVTYKVLDTLPEKGPIPTNLDETKSGTINNLVDYTDFTFFLSQDQGIKLIFTPSGGEAKYRVSLIDSTNSVVDQADCLDHYAVTLEAAHAAGNYTIRVTPIDAVDAESPFTVQLAASTQQVEKEENNLALTATAFDTTQSIAGRLSTNGDVDFYSFDLTAPRFLALAFSCPGTTKNFNMTIYKETEDNPIDGIFVLKAATLYMGLGMGRYFIKVGGDGVNVETVQPYKLTMTDSDQTNLEIESNNTLRFANAIDTATSRRCRIYSQVDKDYFGFHLGEEGFFTVHFTPSTMTGDYRVSVVDENDFALESYTSYNGQALHQEMYNIPRNFYIKIEPNGDIDQFKTYEVSLSSTRQIVGLKQLVAVSVSGQTAKMTTGGTQTVAAIAGYSDATTEAIASPIWSSLNETVATVDAGGMVTAAAEGSTSIVASYGGLTGKFDVVVGAPAQTVSQHYGNLILVAGGGAEITNTLKESTQYLSDLVYLRFRNRLFTDKDIYYFNPVTWHDIDGDGYDNNVVDDSSPTVAEFGQAMTQWAASQSTDGPLYVYLIDHGGIDTFKIFPNAILTATQLKSYLDQFQQATGRKVIVVIEACKSGSFTDDLISQGQNRIVVTSTDEQDAYLQLAGKISFTQLFIDRLLTGDSVHQGWLKAKLQLNNMGLPYNLMDPQLAEGISMVSAQTWIGGDFAIAALYPEIADQSQNTFIMANTMQAFYVDISDLEGIETVWAVVLPPNYVPPPPSQDLEAPEVVLPTFNLTDPEKDGRYEGSYSNFAYNGEYRITFYARNAKGNVTVSPATIVTVSGGQDVQVVQGDINGDGFVTLIDAIIALKGLIGTGPAWVDKGADVNGDGKIGMAEVIYILQKAAELR